MIGLKFKVKNEYNNYLYKILYSVDILKYNWEIVTDDIICSKNIKSNEGLFGTNMIDGYTFLNRIENDKYYMLFVDLKAFPIGSSHTHIESFNDFLESDCEIILLCVDSEFIEFYCKDKEILNIVFNNCIKFGLESIEYISAKNSLNKSVIAF